MNLNCSEVGRHGLWVKPRDRVLSEDNAWGLTDHVLDQARTTGRVFVYLNLRRVEVLDELVLIRLVALHFRLAELGGHLWLGHLRPEVYYLLRLHRLTDVLDVRHDRIKRPFYYAARRLAAWQKTRGW